MKISVDITVHKTGLQVTRRFYKILMIRIIHIFIKIITYEMIQPVPYCLKKELAASMLEVKHP